MIWLFPKIHISITTKIYQTTHTYIFKKIKKILYQNGIYYKIWVIKRTIDTFLILEIIKILK
jgi:hypothetical protein